MGAQQKRTYRRLKRKTKKYESKRRRRQVKSNTMHVNYKSPSQSLGYGNLLGLKIDNDKSKQRSRKRRSKQRRYARDTKHVYVKNGYFANPKVYKCAKCEKEIDGVDMLQSYDNRSEMW
jgi:hypothetical protein